MAKVREIKIAFTPSGSPDVVGYKMYYVDTDKVLGYDSASVDLGNPAPDVSDGKIRIDISALGVFTDGTYDVGVVSVDDAGNESSMSKLTAVPFDFVAPDAPGEIQIEVV